MGDPRFSLEGRVALVTGSAQGLGQAIAIGLAQAGADVAVHDRTDACRDETCDRIRALQRRTLSLAGDIADPTVPDRIVAETIAGLGRFDILVNNAGTIRRAPAAETSDEDWLAVIDINLNGVFRACRAAGRHMLGSGYGKIVNIASLLAFQGGILVPAYAASKGGVAQITKALANEWSGRGVNVNAIAPGYMATANTAALRADANRSRQILERIPAGRWGQPEDVAGAAVFLACPAADYIHGHVLAVDGGWLAR
jgi:2-dehydro-3-deoxy-D-gluconate 5-dehydrogenase